MPDPAVLSNELAIVFGVITTVITILSVLVAVFQWRGHRNVMARRQKEDIEARPNDIPLLEGANQGLLDHMDIHRFGDILVFRSGRGAALSSRPTNSQRRS